jgi:diguanylate cyclase (GGDEF)-like protein
MNEAKKQASEKLVTMIKKLERKNEQTGILSEMRELLQACSSTSEIPQIVSGSMKKLFPGIEGALFIMSPSRSDLESVIRWGGFPEDIDDNVFAPDACWALLRGRSHIVDNSDIGPFCLHVKQPVTGYACIPLIAKGDVLGMVHLKEQIAADGLEREKFISDIKELAPLISEYLSLYVANIKLGEKLAAESIRDPLTGLFNRRYLEESLQREMRRAEREKKQVGIIMSDIDHFKQFNDTYGHAAGDRVLARVGELLRLKIRGGDVACRYGGEEFTIFLTESSLEDSFHRAEQMRKDIENLEIRIRDDISVSITMSFGISSYPGNGANIQDLLRSADIALYKAKQEGRNRVVVSSPVQQPDISARI